MHRSPIVAGQFYPGSKQAWEQEVRGYLAQAVEPQTPGVLAMVPHAGYPFSGAVAGKTLGQADLPRDLLLLGPNHTGMGQRLAVWDRGYWDIPGASISVHQLLAQKLTRNCPGLESDQLAHLREHSLEVILPFLWVLDPKTQIVPITVAETRLPNLLSVADRMTEILSQQDQRPGIVVSSDMSHFISKQEAKRLDELALQAILDLDPEGLLDVVQREKISMCGALPMTMGLRIAKGLGASKAHLVDYATSAEITGDDAQVVGYAGVIIS